MIEKLLLPGKVVVLTGARQVGKTTLVKKMIEEVGEAYLYVTGEDILVREYLGSRSLVKLREFIGERRLLVVDEAQYIPEVGLNLKMLVDSMPDLGSRARASSSRHLADDGGEPLAGRKCTVRMFPLSQAEISRLEPAHETKGRLETRLIYGSFPEVVTTEDNGLRRKYLEELVSSYLFKDILELEGIRYSETLVRLLQLLAHQIGSQVSVSELGKSVGMSKATVDRYLDLLVKVFVLHRVPGFGRNLRKEITRNPRFYFLDNGLRNALISKFNPLAIRDDVGMLWENYVVMERMKRLESRGDTVSTYFWRTYDGQEIDHIEESGGRLSAFEMKWSDKRVRPPSAWASAYPDSSYSVIHRDNYLEFIM